MCARSRHVRFINDITYIALAGCVDLDRPHHRLDQNTAKQHKDVRGGTSLVSPSQPPRRARTGLTTRDTEGRIGQKNASLHSASFGLAARRVWMRRGARRAARTGLWSLNSVMWEKGEGGLGWVGGALRLRLLGEAPLSWSSNIRDKAEHVPPCMLGEKACRQCAAKTPWRAQLWATRWGYPACARSLAICALLLDT